MKEGFEGANGGDCIFVALVATGDQVLLFFVLFRELLLRGRDRRAQLHCPRP